MEKGFIGIDPGLDGAITFLTENNISIVDTPTLTIQSGKRKKREYNIAQMIDSIFDYFSYPITDISFEVGLEKIHSMPGQGVRSMFSMGEGYGIWKGIIAMTRWPLTLVTPQKWKKEMMPGMGKEKDASRLRALQLFPHISDQLNLKKHHGRADSLLIAAYMSKK